MKPTANCPIYWLLLENVVRAPSFNAENHQKKPIKSKICKKLHHRRRTKKHLPKQNTKKIGSMRSTRLRFLETTSFSVHIKTLSSKIVKHQIMPELGPREQSSRSKIIATISPRNQTCLTQTPFSLQRNLSEKNPLSPSSTILKNKQ